jgi:hypothetical protein
MKKVWVCLVIAVVGYALLVHSASALPPFNKEWMAKYKEGNSNAKFVAAVEEAKCNVCHKGTSKKDHNEYGKVVQKFLKKAKYNEIKDDETKAKQYILEGLQKAEAEKAKNGKTYGEILKAGELPGS